MNKGTLTYNLWCSHLGGLITSYNNTLACRLPKPELPKDFLRDLYNKGYDYDIAFEKWVEEAERQSNN